MKMVSELNEHDIEVILSNYYESFNMKVTNVELIPYITTEGYGMAEHEVARVRAKITLIV